MEHGTRDELLSRLAEAVGAVRTAHPTRVAIDGVPAAGKTTLADELAVVLRAHGREVIRATIEGFLTPRSVRHPLGEESAEDWYHHSTVLVFDGVFLLRPELMDRWDLRIFVSAPFEKTR